MLFRETSEPTSEIAGVNVLLAINVFVTPLIAYGLTVGMAARRLEKPIAHAPRLRSVTAAGDILLVVVGLLGGGGLVFAIANIITRSMQS